MVKARQMVKEENNLRETSDGPNTLAQSQPAVKYSGGALLMVSPNAPSMWGKEGSLMR